MFIKIKKSFTLLETIISVFVFSCLTILVALAIPTIYRTHSYQWQQGLAILEARKGVEMMVKEIREAREGENGAYPVEMAGDKEFVFYSDVDNDGKTERVRYFLGKIDERTIVQECESRNLGGSCSVSFSNFFSGTLKEAKVTIFLRGDLGRSNEYVDVYLLPENTKLGTLCQSNCVNCSESWQGMAVFNVTTSSLDNNLSLLIDASEKVDPICPPENFSVRARVELYVKEEVQGTELKKGVIKATGTFSSYPSEEEKVSVISQYVRNAPPIFEYYDKEGNKIEEYPARLKNTKVMKIFLVVNVDPIQPPTEYQLESYVQIRNLKEK